MVHNGLHDKQHTQCKDRLCHGVPHASLHHSKRLIGCWVRRCSRNHLISPCLGTELLKHHRGRMVVAQKGQLNRTIARSLVAKTLEQSAQSSQHNSAHSNEAMPESCMSWPERARAQRLIRAEMHRPSKLG